MSTTNQATPDGPPEAESPVKKTLATQGTSIVNDPVFEAAREAADDALETFIRYDEASGDTAAFLALGHAMFAADAALIAVIDAYCARQVARAVNPQSSVTNSRQDQAEAP